MHWEQCKNMHHKSHHLNHSHCHPWLLFCHLICIVWCLTTSDRLIVGFRQPLGGEGIVPVVPHVANKHQHLLTVSQPANQILSNIFVHQNLIQLSIFIPPLCSCGSNDTTRNGLICNRLAKWKSRKQETYFKKKDQLAKVLSNATISRSLKLEEEVLPTGKTG